MLLPVIFCVILGTLKVTCSPTYVITAPDVFRVDNDVTVCLDLIGIGNVSIQLSLQKYPNRDIAYQSVSINATEGLNKVILRIDSLNLADVSNDVEHAYLMATSSDPRLTFSKESVVLISRQSGFIFIQTDKPIYTPDQEVKIRVIPLNEERLPVAKPVLIDVKNPQGIIVQRWNSTWSRRFVTHSFELPDIPFVGNNWTIEASFADNTAVRKIAFFEVREYVPPRFSVDIDAGRTKIILPRTDQIVITVSARYVYGKMVNGEAFLSLGVQVDGRYELCHFRLKKMLSSGVAIFNVSMTEVSQSLQPYWFPDGARLHIEAEVMDQASGYKEKAFDWSIAFALRPFRISVEGSRFYFKPGLNHELHIKTNWVNRESAGNVPFSLVATRTSKYGLSNEGRLHRLTTNDKGLYTYPISTTTLDDRIQFTIKTTDSRFPLDQQASLTVDINAMRTTSGAFINIRASKNGDTIQVFLFTSEFLPSNVTYMVLAQGRVLSSASLTIVGGMHVVSTPIQTAMSPRCRFVAYFLKQTTTGQEIVSDSVEMNIDPICRTRDVTIRVDDPTVLPGGSSILRVSGPPRANVGFLAVDKAIYLLSDTGLLTKQSLFDEYATHYTDCGTGGGHSSNQIFQDSGLTVISSLNIRISQRDTTGCNRISRRKRSSDELSGIIATHPCCVAGDLFGRNLTEEKDCFEEGKSVFNLTGSTGCSKVFYRCCKRYIIIPLGPSNPGRVVNTGTREYTFRDIDSLPNLQMRSYFPESWLFEDAFLGADGNHSEFLRVPHSITTHVIHAMSLSSADGLCVADDAEILAYQDFFVDVDLPYSIVRLEQTEFRATIYNYRDVSLPCRIYMNSSEEICSSKTNTISVRVNPNDAETVRFPIVPLRAGRYPIEIVVRSVGVGDWVRKMVYVINEGKEERKTVSFWVDPHMQKGRQTSQGDMRVNISHPQTTIGLQETDVDLILPKDAIPGTEQCQAAVTGNLMDSVVMSVIEDVDQMLNRIPRGCGEQTMIILAPIVYALKYLHGTNQIQENHKLRGQRLVSKGIQKLLRFRKTDGSFGIWPHKPSSTWLTAFVLRVLCEAQKYHHIDEHILCSGIRYILSKQRTDGAFDDDSPIYHKEMLGGNIGDISRTAYILISIRECSCSSLEAGPDIQRAVQYLETNLDSARRPYSLAISTYALALSDSNRKNIANRRLKLQAKNKFFSTTGINGFRYWEEETENAGDAYRSPWYRRNSPAINVEVTSYALLAQLELNDLEYSKNIVEWLLDKRQSSKEFVSTQDTVVALHALSLYNIRTYARDINLNISLSSTSNAQFRKDLMLTQGDALVQKSVDDVPVNGKLGVVSRGSGVARMDVEVRYNVNVTENDLCKFSVEVFDKPVKLDLLQQQGFTPEDLQCDVCGYCTPIDPDAFPEVSEKYNVPDLAPRIRGLSFHRRSQRSATDQQTSRRIVCLEICVSYLGYRKLDMPVVDVGLPTGFRVVESDLATMKSSGVADNYEVSKRSVTLYLDNIPSLDDLCLQFRVVKEFDVENLQSAKIEVYDYYQEDERCMKFYSLKYEEAALDIFCSKGNCTCVEDSCAESWDAKLQYNQISKQQLYQRTCNLYDYVIRVEVTNVFVSGNHLVFSASVKSVIKPGKGNIQRNDEIEFWVNLRCETELEVDHYFYIYGKDSIVYTDERGHLRYRYYLQGESAIFKDYTRTQYVLNSDLRYWGRYLRRLERHIRVRGC
uniref:Complement C3-like n=1 Tax=Crassostrea virginica TaxID=6565 RepID=A0A8B8F083_CRAVI|nr:complement C3-like [Crassostrea virginica]